MEIAVFIHTFLRDDCLFRCVESVKKFVPEAKIYISDGGHMTPEKKRYYDSLDAYVEHLDFNYPWRKAFNEKVPKSKEKYIMKLDDDMYLTSGVDELKKMMENYDLAGCRLWHEHRDEPSPYIYKIKGKQGDTYVWEPSGPEDCDVVPDAWLAKREVLENVPMNGALLIGQGGHEDFFMRIYKSKYRVGYTEKMTIYHDKTSQSDEYTEHRNKNPFVFEKDWGRVKRERPWPKK